MDERTVFLVNIEGNVEAVCIRRIILRIVGISIIIAILFSYIPAISMESCPEEDHSTDSGMDCGYSFHCPIVFDKLMSEMLTLPFKGRFFLAPPLLIGEEVVPQIFHPPKNLR